MIDAIVVHTAGDPRNRDASAEDLRKFHKNVRGWRDIGYQTVVRQDGTREAGRPFNDDDRWDPWEYGAQVKGANDRTFGICCTGNGDIAPLTEAQEAGLVDECAERCQQFGKTAEDVIGHHEVDERIGAPNPYKTCPGKFVDMDRIRGLVRERLSEVSC